MLFFILLLFACLFIAGYIGMFLGKKLKGALTPLQNFFFGIAGFAFTGAITTAICLFISSKTESLLQAEGDKVFFFILTGTIIGAFVGAVLLPVLLNLFIKKR